MIPINHRNGNWTNNKTFMEKSHCEGRNFGYGTFEIFRDYGFTKRDSSVLKMTSTDLYFWSICVEHLNLQTNPPNQLQCQKEDLVLGMQ
jgi:hypothetical protein